MENSIEQVANASVEGTGTTNTPLITIGVHEYMKQKGFVSVASSVRENANGYPFVTFINAANVAENIYFSVSASAKMEKGQRIGKEFFNDLRIALTTNADGEARVKIVGTSDNRTSFADLFTDEQKAIVSEASNLTAFASL